MIKNIKWILIASLGIVSCSQEVEDTSGIEPEVVVSAGTANFSRYVALGNSLTAGFSDGALFKAGQMNAYPKLLADQFALAGGGAFTIPYMSDNTGGLLFGGIVNEDYLPRLVIEKFENGLPVIKSLIQAPYKIFPTTETFSVLSGPFNNMGVPGAKSFHLLAPGYGSPAGLLADPITANPYFVRFASSQTASVLEDAMAQNPTFFSLWIGNNDVLGYALSGGDGSNPITPLTGAPGVGFEATYNTLVGTLTSAGAKGVIGNIPDVKTIPHFKVVTYNPLSPTNPSFGPQIPTLNAEYARLNAAYTFLGVPERSISFSATSNSAVVVHDESIPNISLQLAPVLQAGGLDILTATLLASQYGQCRQAKPTDLFVLPASSIIGEVNTTRLNALIGVGVPAETAAELSVNGVTFPLEDKWVLLPSEQNEIEAATIAFNDVIKNAAASKGLAFVDANAVLKQLANGGILSGTYHFTNQFIQGGAFGLDGVHLTPRANAYIANKFLEAIERTYGSSFRKYKPQDFPLSYPAFLQ